MTSGPVPQTYGIGRSFAPHVTSVRVEAREETPRNRAGSRSPHRDDSNLASRSVDEKKLPGTGKRSRWTHRYLPGCIRDVWGEVSMSLWITSTSSSTTSATRWRRRFAPPSRLANAPFGARTGAGSAWCCVPKLEGRKRRPRRNGRS